MTAGRQRIRYFKDVEAPRDICWLFKSLDVPPKKAELEFSITQLTNIVVSTVFGSH
jgi:hypothetical protein